MEITNTHYECHWSDSIYRYTHWSIFILSRDEVDSMHIKTGITFLRLITPCWSISNISIKFDQFCLHLELLPLDCEQCSNAGKMIWEICLINKSRVAFSLTTTFDELATPTYKPNHKIVKPEISARVVLDVDKNSENLNEDNTKNELIFGIVITLFIWKGFSKPSQICYTLVNTWLTSGRLECPPVILWLSVVDYKLQACMHEHA